MRMPFSKKELLKDNRKMRGEIENLVARNAELVIMMEQSKALIEEANLRIDKYNKKVDEKCSQ